MNYSRDPDGTLILEPTKFIEKIMVTYENIFHESPTKFKTPLVPNDHPETDTSELCDGVETQHYMTMIGQLQWLIALGRFDIFPATVTMSRFRVAPRKGHLERLKQVYGYVLDSKDGSIRVRTDEPDLSNFPDQVFDWTESIYGKVKEIIPNDIPEALGKGIVMISYVDANLYHDYVTGRALTAVLHLINQTPFDWYCKRQPTVQTATFGAEFVAAKTAVEQIIENRLVLMYFGVPIIGKTYLFGDNASVITNSTIPHSQLTKRHQALAYHKVREAIASDMLNFHFIHGEVNPADILSKHWAYHKVGPMLKALLFWKGETKDIPDIIQEKKLQREREKQTKKTEISQDEKKKTVDNSQHIQE
jgi:hypothetical protein